MKKLFIIIISILMVGGLTIKLAYHGQLFKLAHAESAEHVEEEDRDEEDEDEEDEDEDEYEDREEETITETITESDDSPSDETVEEVITVMEPKVVYVWSFDVGYDVDSDGDGLVDALDPHPTVKEVLYFTDTDNDGVADAFDQHPNENDFTYVTDTDDNNNGISDSFEQ